MVLEAVVISLEAEVVVEEVLISLEEEVVISLEAVVALVLT